LGTFPTVDGDTREMGQVLICLSEKRIGVWEKTTDHTIWAFVTGTVIKQG
jgi:hypothetical protein